MSNVDLTSCLGCGLTVDTLGRPAMDIQSFEDWPYGGNVNDCGTDLFCAPDGTVKGAPIPCYQRANGFQQYNADIFTGIQVAPGEVLNIDLPEVCITNSGCFQAWVEGRYGFDLNVFGGAESIFQAGGAVSVDGQAFTAPVYGEACYGTGNVTLYCAEVENGHNPVTLVAGDANNYLDVGDEMCVRYRLVVNNIGQTQTIVVAAYELFYRMHLVSIPRC